MHTLKKSSFNLFFYKTRQTREDFVVATKCRANMGYNVNSVGLSRRHITKSIEDSLQRLHTDYVDVYQVSQPVQLWGISLEPYFSMSRIHYTIITILTYPQWTWQS